MVANFCFFGLDILFPFSVAFAMYHLKAGYSLSATRFIFADDIIEGDAEDPGQQIDAIDLGLEIGEEMALDDSLDASLLNGNYDDALSEDVLLDLEVLRKVLAPLITEVGPQPESGLLEPSVEFPEGPKTSTPRASPSLIELVVANSPKNVPLDPADIPGPSCRAGGSSSWADTMEVEFQSDVAHGVSAGGLELPPVLQVVEERISSGVSGEVVSGEQEVCPHLSITFSILFGGWLPAIAL
jgi:hypothetical protein